MLCCAMVLGTGAATAKTMSATQGGADAVGAGGAGLETLEAIPEGARTRADYTRAMDGFRAVYHAAPGDVHAPDSVNAVAELLAEQGRGLHDAKSLKAAVGQYEFLRTQYPGSSLRVGALLAEGQIYENDLHDAAAARERYALLVKQYPRSAQAEEAKAGIASLDAGQIRAQRGGGGAESLKAQGRRRRRSVEMLAVAEGICADGPVRGPVRSPGQRRAVRVAFAPMPTTVMPSDAVTRGTATPVDARAGCCDGGGAGCAGSGGSADACGEDGGEAAWADGAGDGDPALVDAELYAGGDRPGRRCDV